MSRRTLPPGVVVRNEGSGRAWTTGVIALGVAGLAAIALTACQNGAVQDDSAGVVTSYVTTPDGGKVLCASMRDNSHGAVALSCDWTSRIPNTGTIKR
jgi:hypothetical protein